MTPMLALPIIASPERIREIDYADWEENTDFGLPPGQEIRAWDDLVWCDSLGPYTKAYWTHYEPDWRLPVIRGTFWSDVRGIWGCDPDQMRVELDDGVGRRSFLVDRIEGPVYGGPEKEAIRRVLRVLVRREHGYSTTYTARAYGLAAPGAAAA